MIRSYTPSQIADSILAGEITRDSAFVPLAEVEKLRAERDEARAEVERLREALRDALDGLRYWVPQTSVGAVEKCRIMEKGIEALEVKSAVERCRFMENGIEALEVNP
jgi:hypothetical protein